MQGVLARHRPMPRDAPASDTMALPFGVCAALFRRTCWLMGMGISSPACFSWRLSGAPLAALLRDDFGFEDVRIVPDQFGLDRFVAGRAPR